MAKATTKKRAARPAAERAQEALDTTERVLAAAKARLEKAKATVKEIEADVEAAQRKRDYAALNPDLPAQTQAAEVLGDGASD